MEDFTIQDWAAWASEYHGIDTDGTRVKQQKAVKKKEEVDDIDFDSNGIPILPEEPEDKKWRRPELESIVRKYLNAHYCMHTITSHEMLED